MERSIVIHFQCPLEVGGPVHIHIVLGQEKDRIAIHDIRDVLFGSDDHMVRALLALFVLTDGALLGRAQRRALHTLVAKLGARREVGSLVIRLRQDHPPILVEAQVPARGFGGVIAHGRMRCGHGKEEEGSAENFASHFVCLCMCGEEKGDSLMRGKERARGVCCVGCKTSSE
jgi:hypothetical protein